MCFACLIVINPTKYFGNNCITMSVYHSSQTYSKIFILGYILCFL